MKNVNNRMLDALRLAGCVSAVMAGLASGPALAALADRPLFTSTATSVKPNIMFILDDSGSMKSDYLPDAAGNFDDDTYGTASPQCNGVAYNPATTYLIPVDYKGADVAAPSLSIFIPDISSLTSPHTISTNVAMPAVGDTVTVSQVQGSSPKSSWYANGDVETVYQSATKYFVGKVTAWNAGTRQLSIKVTKTLGTGTLASPTVADGQPTKPQYTYYTYDKTKGSQLPLNFSYKTDGSVIGDTFYNECNSTVGDAPGKDVFKAVTLDITSAEAQKYANWYTYYRTRMSMMKSSISLAFKDLDDKLRIGYSTISQDTVAPGSNFLDVKDFTSASGGQKEAFYKAVNAANPISWTPLRGALSKAGQYYANKASGQKYDPIQYSCQRNFTILSTDGQWNANDEDTNYGPYGLDGKNVGDVDGTDATNFPRPMLDANKASNTLADVAAYYYKTDLRTPALGNCTGSVTGQDVCVNNVPGKPLPDAYRSGGDKIATQHMTTFTLGLGVAGNLDFNKDYLDLRSGDFHKIVNNSLDWPTPAANTPSAVDDLWHAAVNGRGQFFSAGTPDALAESIALALQSINAVTGSASAASTSSLQPVAGDNDIYVAQFTTDEWTGDVKSYKIDPLTGKIDTSVLTWSAQAQLKAKAWATRKIYYAKPGASTPTLRDFNYTNLKADGLNGNFDSFCTGTLISASGTGKPSQCDDLVAKDLLNGNTALVTAANSGANLVAYLAGDTTKDYYRFRKFVLGDIINASPLYVGKPQFKYSDAGYDAFKTAQDTRTKVVLAAANDGFLHAFDRVTGNELWAYVPSFVLPNIYKLADEAFTFNHSYFVDGSPQIGDVFDGTNWKTIVVGGMNKGGRGYYALDVTDPGAPKLLWEFKDKNLGYTYGNPIITKRTDGSWVVVFGSGYENNVDAGLGAGDGNGHLFVLDALKGTKKEDVATFTDASSTVAAGSVALPSGVSRINNWVVNDDDNTSLRFYGGDMLGNVWRWDIDSQVAPNKKALLLAQLKTSATVGQPVTVKPALAEVNYNGAKYPVVYVPTGAYIRTTDPLDTSTQSIYAIKDPLTDSSYGDIRKDVKMVVQTMAVTTDPVTQKPSRSQTINPVDWNTKIGWRVDLPATGERVSVNPQLALETLYVGSNIPSSDACTLGGDSVLYEFNINDGSFTPTSLTGVLVEGLTVVQLTTGSNAGSIVTIITRSDGTVTTDVNAPVSPTPALKRSSWRELVE
jgi:type IV pilus assembly protein PilY1